MLRHLILAAMVTTVAACSDAPSSDPGVGVVVTAVERGLDAIDDAGAATCTLERNTITRAVETFELLVGRPPGAEAELVPDWLTEESTLFDVVDGRVVPAPDSPCD